ncbi:hypothetical protein [Paraliomyxa miuraensis]|uniref:hypothetical protein n=1 Tax=Paraliomyxa miuraensis TaxID=376150 RepID=UPI00224DD9AA|nr:hypothetical protein [Paraliomyxa miuraensis]
MMDALGRAGWRSSLLAVAMASFLAGCGDDSSSHPPASTDDPSASTASEDSGLDGSTTSGADESSASGDESGDPSLADFSRASPELVEFAIGTGLGLRTSDAYSAIMQGEVHGEATQGQCPIRDYIGDTMTLTGTGCTTDDGYTYDGMVSAQNAITLRDLLGSPTYDVSRPMVLQFDALSIARPGGGRAFEGRVEQSSPMAEHYTSHSTLAADYGTRRSIEDLEASCTLVDGERQCTITSGSAMIDGLGEFSIRGMIGSANARFFGWLELVGQQTLRVDLDAVDAGCHPYAIDGELAGEVCVSSPEPPPLTLDLGYGAGCLDEQLRLEGYVDADVDAMSMEVLGPQMVTPLRTPLTNPTPTADGQWAWSAIASIDGIPWSCDELGETTFRLIARLDGERACDAWGPAASAAPADCADW